jgi:hypothetical protein
MTSILTPRDADRAMQYAERAAAQAETELAEDNPLRSTALFAVARLRHNAGEATPPGYDGPDPDTHGVAATLGFIFAGSPWDVGRVPALSADVAVQPLPEAPAETGTP